jgi:hypothetical protein
LGRRGDEQEEEDISHWRKKEGKEEKLNCVVKLWTAYFCLEYNPLRTHCHLMARYKTETISQDLFGKTYWHQNEHGRDYGHNHDDYDAAALWREEDEYNEIDYVPSTMETITSTTLTMDLTTTPDTTI